MQIQGSFRVDEDFVGNGGQVIGTLAIALAVSDEELARLFELDEFVADLLQGGSGGRDATQFHVDALDVGEFVPVVGMPIVRLGLGWNP